MSADTHTILSVIIVSWNTRDLLQRCLESIRATVPPVPFEVIVVDNASSDGSAEMTEERFPEVVLIKNDSNYGFASGNNLGIEKASGKYLLLLNPDAELRENAAQELLYFMDEHSEVAIVGPKLLNSDGSLQKNGRLFPTFAREVLHLTKLYRLMHNFDLKFEWGREDFDAECEVDSLCGACLLVRKSAVDAVGLLDERFFMYYEEIDWCFSMRKVGWKIWYIPSAQVVHHVGGGSKSIGLRKVRIAYASQYLYFLKNHSLASALLLRILSGVVLGLMSARLFATGGLSQR